MAAKRAAERARRRIFDELMMVGGLVLRVVILRVWGCFAVERAGWRAWSLELWVVDSPFIEFELR